MRTTPAPYNQKPEIPMPRLDKPVCVRPDVAAAALGLSVESVRKLIRQGVIQAVHLGLRATIIPVSELERVSGLPNLAAEAAKEQAPPPSPGSVRLRRAK